MASVRETLKTAHSIDGSIAVAIVDWKSGMALGTEGGGSDLKIDVAAAGNTEVVRAKRNVMRDLGIDGGIEDILITLDDQYHIIMPIEGTTVFLYSALWRDKANLAMARYKLAAATKDLSI